LVSGEAGNGTGPVGTAGRAAEGIKCCQGPARRELEDCAVAGGAAKEGRPVKIAGAVGNKDGIRPRPVGAIKLVEQGIDPARRALKDRAVRVYAA